MNGGSKNSLGIISRLLVRQNGDGVGQHGLRIVLYDPSTSGGVAQYTYHLAQNLTDLGGDVTVITGDNYELNDQHRNFKLRILFKRSRMKYFLGIVFPKFHHENSAAAIAGESQRPLNDAAAASDALSIYAALKNVRRRMLDFKAIALLLLARAEVVHFQWLGNRQQDYRLMRILKRLGFKILYTAHDLVPHSRNTAEVRDSLARIYSLADGIILHSESNKREMASMFGLDNHKLFVVPHGSSDLFSDDRIVSEEAARQRLGIERDKKVILFFGYIKLYKGLEYLVEAFEKAKNRVPGLFLLVAGKIPKGDRQAFARYSGLMKELGCCKDVLCVPEYVPVKMIRDYFAASDVAVLPYVKTYTSGVLLSAYAAGRPVIVTDTGGLAEVVEVGKSGYVVPPGDVSALAGAIESVFETPEKPDRMGRYAKNLADTTYSWQQAARKTIDLYRRLVLPVP